MWAKRLQFIIIISTGVLVSRTAVTSIWTVASVSRLKGDTRQRVWQGRARESGRHNLRPQGPISKAVRLGMGQAVDT